MPPTPTKSESALNAATKLFTEDHYLTDALEALRLGKRTFLPDLTGGYAGDPIDTEQHLADLADAAWSVSIDCKNAGLTALGELAKALDKRIRKVLVDGPRYVKASLPDFVRLTNDATNMLDATSDALETAQ